MRKRSKRYKADAAKVDREKKYAPAEAVKVLKSFTPTKADQSIEIAVKLAIDPKKSEQSIRGSVSLPKGIGKARRVIVFADGAEAQQATGGRSFEILFGPHNGSTRATLFAGFVPPGKAAWHYHLYDEIVWVPAGPGRLHRADGEEQLDAGTAFRLRPRQVHIVENAGASEMTIIGVFTPAGSPSAAYLTPDVAAAYRFASR